MSGGEAEDKHTPLPAEGAGAAGTFDPSMVRLDLTDSPQPVLGPTVEPPTPMSAIAGGLMSPRGAREVNDNKQEGVDLSRL
jgi:hypothetical protein